MRMAVTKEAVDKAKADALVLDAAIAVADAVNAAAAVYAADALAATAKAAWDRYNSLKREYEKNES